MSSQSIDLCILKSLLNNKKYALDFVSEQDSKLFNIEVWNFANLVIEYIKIYKEIPTLRVLIEKNTKKNNEKLIEHIKKVWDQIENIQYDYKEYNFDLEKLKKRFAEKQILQLKDTLNKCEPDKIDINKQVFDLQKTIQNIKELNNIKAFECKNVKDYISTFVDKYNAKKENPAIEAGIKTKYSIFDFATNGVKPADFVIIAGESGFGKSLLLQNMAIQTWMQACDIENADFKNGKNIIYFSLEMPYEDCFNRLLSRLSGVPSRKLENCQLNKEEFIKVKKSLDFIKEYPYQFKIVDIANACSNDLERILTESQEKFDVIFIDYLGIMETNEKSDESDWLKQGVISYEIRAIARRHKLPIFSAVQLNRKAPGKDSSDNIGLHRLARSATVATHCTHVIQIESREREEMHFDFIFHLIKNRKGPKVKGSLIKKLDCATLLDPKIDNDGDNNNYDDYFKNQEDISEFLEKLEF